MKKLGMILAVVMFLSVAAWPVKAAACSAANEDAAVETAGEEDAEGIAVAEDVNKAATSKDDLVTAIKKDSELSTLSTLLNAAKLTDALKAKGPFTIFAPTNAAFDKLPKELVTELLKPENSAKLADILKYHVFPGAVDAETAKKLDGKEITMLNDKKAKVAFKNGELYINDAKVIMKDQKVKNGIIHTIDTVIVPK